MEGLERLLREHDFLKDLSADQARFLVSCVRNVRFAAGQFLLREGGEASVFYLLRRGRVALEIHVPGRGTVQMESLGPGDVLGLSWFIPPYREHLDARATESVVALAFNGQCLRDKLEADHELGFALARRLFEQAYHRLERVRLQRVDVYQER
jgi:CRP/FNR family cyclic AMP-dependent transcriptional regulator